MGKKIKAEMNAQRERFVSGAVERGLSKDKASHIFDLMAKFAGYGFNKCHAAPYGLVAYQTAYLKANHPVEFLAASMTLDMGNTDKLNVFKQELDRLGIKLLPPDVNASGVEFTVERLENGTKAVRYALAAIKNVGAQAMADVVAERHANGRFRDLFDFARRIDGRVMNKRQLENLARAGAFDELESNRARVGGSVDLLVRYNAVVTEERLSQQESLFGGGGEGEGAAAPDMAEVEPWLPSDRLREEFEAIGFHLSAHPLEPYREILERMSVVTFAEAEEQAIQRGASVFKLAGVPVSRRERTSGNGSRFAFAVVSDTSGSYEIVLFSEVLAASRALLDDHQPLLIEASARVDGDAVKFSASRLELLDRAAAGASAEFRVHLADTEALPRLESFLSQAKTGRGRILLVLDRGPRRVEVALAQGYALSPGLRTAIEAMSGVAEVIDEANPLERRDRTGQYGHLSLASPGAAR
jgi:DNA polymerase III subunit alpha